MTVPAHPAESVPACTALGVLVTLEAALVHGVLPAGSPAVWPLVVLAVAGLAHDLARQALRRRRPHH